MRIQKITSEVNSQPRDGNCGHPRRQTQNVTNCTDKEAIREQTKNKQSWCWKLDHRGPRGRCRESLPWQPVGLGCSSPMVRQRSAEAFAAAAAAHRARKREHWMWRRRGNEGGKGGGRGGGGGGGGEGENSLVERLHRLHAGRAHQRIDSQWWFTVFLCYRRQTTLQTCMRAW